MIQHFQMKFLMSKNIIIENERENSWDSLLSALRTANKWRSMTGSENSIA